VVAWDGQLHRVPRTNKAIFLVLAGSAVVLSLLRDGKLLAASMRKTRGLGTELGVLELETHADCYCGNTSLSAG